MITGLSNTTKKRIIELIRSILAEHPKYKNDAGNVQNKYAFDERPQRGVVINGVSADRVAMSADNYVGLLVSHAMLAPYRGKPNTTVEWIRENLNTIRQYDSSYTYFPTPSGVHLFKVMKTPDVANEKPGVLEITSILEIVAEECIVVPDGEYGESKLLNRNVYPGTLSIAYNDKRELIDGVDYVVNYEEGLVTFKKNGAFETRLVANYKYSTEVRTEHFYAESVDEKIMQGLQIYFGDRYSLDDEWAIVITDDRVEVAKMYGGRFEITFDILAFSKDAEDREKLSDYIVLKVLERQNSLGTEGIELLDITPGGENEDVFNPETDEYYYESSISMRVRTEWSIQIPLPIKLSRTSFASRLLEGTAGTLDGSLTIDKLTPSSVTTPPQEFVRPKGERII